ncbi:MAG: DUF3108 domain-containing protein [Cellvibrionaceae bacterium]|nr:DUF3108 domain-containing protein [Cellvibrionaceae bacterium]
MQPITQMTVTASRPLLLRPAQLIANWVFSGLLCLSAPAALAEPLPFFSAEYEAEISGFAVQASREFKALNDSTHELRFTATSLFASIDERSQFSWEDTRILPSDYSYERKIMGKKRTRTLQFDRDKQHIKSSENGQSQRLSITHHTLDNLSYQLQLQQDLLTAKSPLHYHIADKHRLKTYQFEVLGDEIIETALGKLTTTKVSLKHNNSQRVTYIWFAKDWHYLLARFEQFEEGKKAFVIQLRKAIVKDRAVTGL